MNSLPQKKELPDITPALQQFTGGLYAFLEQFGLPSQNVLVDIGERAITINNMPSTIKKISDTKRQNSIYISKFVAACSVGLFDAALNFLWDETIAELRKRVVLFDLAYFYDAVITDEKQRLHYKTEDDLKNIDDWQLIRGCKDVGLITDIAFRHLDHIRDMRNYASAAHPNQNDITGLQLASYFDTCVKEVLSKEPDSTIISIGKLLNNIRTQVFTADTVLPICSSIQSIPKAQMASFARSIIGIYTDLRTNSNIRNNIELISKALWSSLTDETKYEIGLKFGHFTVNGDIERAAQVKTFLAKVNGMSYLDENSKTIEIDSRLQRLLFLHDSFNNFYTEGPVIREICEFVPPNGDIPVSIWKRYIKVITICKITNGHGVAWEADEYYNLLIAHWRDREVLELCNLLKDSDVSSRLQSALCTEQYTNILKDLRSKVINNSLQDLINYLLRSTENLDRIGNDSKFNRMLQMVII